MKVNNKHTKAINCIQKRIELLDAKLKELEKDFEEPESIGAYEFISNDISNIEQEILELQNSVALLIK